MPLRTAFKGVMASLPSPVVILTSKINPAKLKDIPLKSIQSISEKDMLSNNDSHNNINVNANSINIKSNNNNDNNKKNNSNNYNNKNIEKIKENSDNTDVGMTISSLSSLSVDPFPLVSFNIRVPSHTSFALHNKKRFLIHILPPNSDSVNLYRRFSKGKNDNLFTDLKIQRYLFPESDKNIINDNTNTNKKNKNHNVIASDNSNINDLINEKNNLSDSFTNLPCLREYSQTIMACSVHSTFKVQDHEIWIARIHSIECGKKSHLNKYTKPINPSDILHKSTVLYTNRKFRIVGDSVE